MVSKRELVLLIMLLVILSGVGYYFFFFTPTMETVSQLTETVGRLENDIRDAEIRELQYSAQVARRDEMTVLFNEYMATLPANFDDADILYRLHDIIYPYTNEINVSLPNEPLLTAKDAVSGEDSNLTAIAVYPVNISFNVSMGSLMAILEGFARQDIDNKVSAYSLSRVEHEGVGHVSYNVTMQVDFIVRQ
jgi:hypothetical protein